MKENMKQKTVVLQDSAIEKIDRWLEQIELKRVRLSRREFLDWLIEKSPENLSNADITSIVERFYNERKFLRQLLRDSKKAEDEGRELNLEIVVRPKKSEVKRETSTEALEEENASVS